MIKYIKILITVVLLLFLPTLISAETIKLHSGKVIEGKIIERGNDFIKLDYGKGVNIVYFKDEIESIDGEKIIDDKNNLSHFTGNQGISKDKLIQVDDDQYEKALFLRMERNKSTIEHVLVEQGYVRETAFSIANLLSTYDFNSPIITDLSNDEELIKDLNHNLALFYALVFNPETNKYDPDPFILNVFYQLIGGEYEDELKSLLPIDNDTLLACTFISYLNYIVYLAKGVEIYGVETRNYQEIDDFLNGSIVEEDPLEKTGHLANLVKLNSGRFVLIDFLNNYISKPFWLDEEVNLKEGLHIFNGNNFPFSDFKLIKGLKFKSIINSNISAVYYDLGSFDRSKYFINKALDIWNNNYSALFVKGSIAFEEGRYDEAYDIGEKCIKAYPTHTAGYVIKGSAAIALEKFNDALSNGQVVVSMNEDHVGGHEILAQAYYHLGDVESSMKEFNRVIDLYKKFNYSQEEFDENELIMKYYGFK